MKKIKKKELKEIEDLLSHIITRGVSTKIGADQVFETTDEEDIFFKHLIQKTIEAKLDPLQLAFEPMSNKSFSVSYQRYPVGKIKLRGRITYMQILKGLFGIKDLENQPLEEYISNIPKWISHMKFCLK